MEENFRRSLLLSNGDPAVFYQQPLSLGMLLVAGVMCLLVLLPQIQRSRTKAFTEQS